MAQMRLDKYLAGMGIATRKELRQIIRSGRVTVNGVTANAPDMRIDADACTIRSFTTTCFISPAASSRRRRTAGRAR